MKKAFRTGDQTLIREINLSIILNCLRSTAPLSRSQLAQMTGLNKTTVSSLVKELLDGGFIKEVGLGNSHGGRRAVMLDLNPNAGNIIGLEIGVDFISIILTDFRARILWRSKRETDPTQNQDTILDLAIELARDARAAAGPDGDSLLGIGIGVPGLVDSSSGVLLFAPNLRWRDVPIKDVFTSELGIPVFVDNDANVAALGERYLGIAQNTEDFIYLAAGVGLGGGIVLGGKLYGGVGGYAGEIGHMTIVENGELCNCGNRGCWETLVSQRAIIKRAQRAAESHRESRIVELCKGQMEQISISTIIQAASEGDETAERVLEETGVYLGVGIANLINALNPALVILGGVLSLASEYLLPAIERTIEERSLAWPRQTVRIMASSYGSDACVMGGVALVLHDILRRPTLAT